MKSYLLLVLTIFFIKVQGQINCQLIDTNDLQIKNAVEFYKQYLSEFQKANLPDFSKYWSKSDCKRCRIPDPILYSISSDYPTYNFGTTKTIFYAEKISNLIHLKTLFADIDSSENITVYAITNHYIKVNKNGDSLSFVSPLEINKDKYATTKNANITYHYPKYIKFNRVKSDSLILQMRKFEKRWGFAPIKFDYYFTKTQHELGVLRGLDYFLGMEQTTPSGMSFSNDKIIYCNGYGEGYLHEVLHLYLNPIYEKSPVNHGLIYYLGGSIGFSFDELIDKMNLYLDKYPTTNLSDFETIQTKDITLNIYNVVTGLLSKMIYEKNGVDGMKRLLKYNDLTKLFKEEFKVEKKDWDSFLKTNFRNQKLKGISK